MSRDPAALWEAFASRLKGFIRKQVGHEEDAEDVLQDVFIRIQGGLPRVRDTSKLESWVFQVTRHAIIDHLRARRNGSAAPSDDLAEERPAGDISALVASWITPLLQELPPQDRQALEHSLQGRSQKDLAEAEGLSPSAARSRVQRARRRLKEVLLKCCEIELDRRGNAISYTRRSASCRRCSCD